jgi:hypothetical protein
MSSPAIDTGKVDTKKRKVFRDSKGRTHVKQGDKKVYVKKLFTPTRSAPVANTPPAINTEKVNAKKRKVFRDSKGRTYVQQGDKKVYVKKLFTPTRSAPARSPARSPVINTEKVNAKKRKVFRDSKGRTYVQQGDKKVYVKKLFTPERNSTPARNQGTSTTIDCSTPRGLGQVSSTCWFNAPLNGFILANATATMIAEQIKKLSSTEIASLAKSFPEDSCPVALSKKYIYHYFMKIHSDELRGGSRNVSVDLIGKLFTPKRLTSPVAGGRNGYTPSVGALKIMKILFGNLVGDSSIVKFQGNWSNSCPIGKNKKIIYRWGPDDIKTLGSDAHPMFIKSHNGKISYKLSHLVYGIEVNWGGGGLHAAVAYVCGNKKFVYDSNRTENMEVDWSDHENLRKILRYSDASKLDEVSYTVYVRE